MFFHDSKEQSKNIHIVTYTYSLTSLAMLFCMAVSWAVFVSGIWQTHGMGLLIGSQIGTTLFVVAFRFISFDRLEFLLPLFIGVLTCLGLMTGVVCSVLIAAGNAFEIILAFSLTVLLFSGSAIYGSYANIDVSRLSAITTLVFYSFIAVSIIWMLLSIWFSSPLIDLLFAYAGIGVYALLSVHNASLLRKYSAVFDSMLSSREKLTFALYISLAMCMNIINMFFSLLHILTSRKRK